jgi:hypothetical protein
MLFVAAFVFVYYTTWALFLVSRERCSGCCRYLHMTAGATRLLGTLQARREDS